MSVLVRSCGVSFVLKSSFRSSRSHGGGSPKTPSTAAGRSDGNWNFDQRFPEFYWSVWAEIFRVALSFHYLSNVVGLGSNEGV